MNFPTLHFINRKIDARIETAHKQKYIQNCINTFIHIIFNIENSRINLFTKQLRRTHTTHETRATKDIIKKNFSRPLIFASVFYAVYRKTLFADKIFYPKYMAKGARGYRHRHSMMIACQCLYAFFFIFLSISPFLFRKRVCTRITKTSIHHASTFRSGEKGKERKNYIEKIK